MTPELILKSFQATGVWPMDADAVLKRFNNHTLEQDKASELGQHGDGDSWRELRKIYDAAVTDKAKVEARQLEASLHSLQVQNELLHHENDGLQRELNTKKKQRTQRITLTIQEGEDWHGGAVFMSPRNLQRARARKAAEQDEAEQLQLQKTHDRELKAAATAYKKKQAEAAKVARQHAAEERRKAKKARAEELAAQRALKSNNEKLKSYKNLTIHLKDPSKKPYTALQKTRQSVVVLWLLEVVLTLVLRLRLPHPKQARAAATLRHQRDLNK
jgi:preprotein translocase subunit SecD